MDEVKLPKNLKMLCNRHGDTMRFDNDSKSYVCIDEFDGSYCASICFIRKGEK